MNFRAPGNKALAILALYSLLRFGGEFYRHPFHESVFSTAQIATALATVTFLAIILYRENRTRRIHYKTNSLREVKFALLFTLWMYVILLNSWFTPVESVLIWGVLFSLTAFMILNVISLEIWSNLFCRPALISAVALLYFVGAPIAAESDSTTKSFYQYGMGFFGGSYGAWDIGEGPSGMIEDDCGGTYTGYPYLDGVERSYRYAGVGTSVEKVTRHTEYESTIIGILVTVGQTITSAVNPNAAV